MAALKFGGLSTAALIVLFGCGGGADPEARSPGSGGAPTNPQHGGRGGGLTAMGGGSGNHSGGGSSITLGGMSSSQGGLAPGQGGTGAQSPSPGLGGRETTVPPDDGSGDADGDDGTNDPPPGDAEDPPPGDTPDPPPGDTPDPPPGDTPDPPPGDTPDPPSSCVPTEIDNINVIVFKDATPSGADTEGRMYVGGNAVLSGYGVASRETALSCDDYALVVGGDLSVSGMSVNNGKVSYGGELTSNGFGAPCGVTKGSATTPVDFAELEAKLTEYSAAFKDYPANGKVVVDGDLFLTGTDPSLNVFNVSAAELNHNFHLSVPKGSSVIVNVSGKQILWSGTGFQLPDGASCRGGSSDWCHRILFNMYEAETIQLGGIGVQGSILAPYATLDGGGGNVDGQVIVEYLKGGIEYHPYFFTGCLMLPKKK